MRKPNLQKLAADGFKKLVSDTNFLFLAGMLSFSSLFARKAEQQLEFQSGFGGAPQFSGPDRVSGQY
jgi:hypothetical protein